MKDKKIPEPESYADLQSHIPDLEIEPGLKAFKNEYSNSNYWVTFESDEFTAVCPRTGLPDFAHITITYMPDELLLESKATKLYLTAYRNVGIFHEHAINKIFNDFLMVVKPKQAAIIGEFHARGGIPIRVEREFMSLKYRRELEKQK